MKIAIPTVDGVLCPHFGQCQQFAVVEIDPETKNIIGSETMTPPPHEPGAFPSWLSQMGCNLIIASGMGRRAIDMFQQSGVDVVIGAQNSKPEEIVTAYMDGELTTSANPCGEPTFRGRKSHRD